jgi:hypothetical protein
MLHVRFGMSDLQLGSAMPRATNIAPGRFRSILLDGEASMSEEISFSAATRRRETVPTSGIIMRCLDCGFAERVPLNSDDHHRCTWLRRARYKLAVRLWPDLALTRSMGGNCGTCSHLILPSENSGGGCIWCDAHLEARVVKPRHAITY